MMSNNWISLALRQKAYRPAHRNDEQNYSTGAQVNIFDLHEESGNATGTKVELVIPV